MSKLPQILNGVCVDSTKVSFSESYDTVYRLVMDKRASDLSMIAQTALDRLCAEELTRFRVKDRQLSRRISDVFLFYDRYKNPKTLPDSTTMLRRAITKADHTNRKRSLRSKAVK